MEEDEGSLVGLNDVNSTIVPKESCFSKQKNILIVSAFIVLFILILVIVIILIPKSEDKKMEKKNHMNLISREIYLEKLNVFMK
jgi:hypothetical protein